MPFEDSTARRISILCLVTIVSIALCFRYIYTIEVDTVESAERPRMRFQYPAKKLEAILASIERPDSASHLAGSDDDKLAGATPALENQRSGRKALVVASMKKDDTSWVEENLPDWEINIYVADDPGARLNVSVNKGREAMAYLTYIIDNYHSLPDHIVFLHSDRYQWHNDDPIYDGVPIIRNLNLAHVTSQGYTNLRCTWLIGCPTEIHPYKYTLLPSDVINTTRTEEVYASSFRSLFPSLPVPHRIGVASGGQFAVSRAQVLQRPRSEYMHYRKWLEETTLPDGISGRIMEYAWHIVFGREAVFCPDAGMCYCNNWGFCELDDCDERACKSRYTLPPYANMPVGWPEKGRGVGGYP